MAIDERRAKFRQDLLGESRPPRPGSHNSRSDEGHLGAPEQTQKANEGEEELDTRYRRSKKRGRSYDKSGGRRSSRIHNASPSRSLGLASEEDSTYSMLPRGHESDEDGDDSDDEADESIPQDVQEVWFPGCHADIGAGWPLQEGEEISLSHGPLVWMVREAQRAGLRFDQAKVEEMKCGGNMGYEEENEAGVGTELHGSLIPEVHITSTGTPGTSGMAGGEPGTTAAAKRSKLHGHLHTAATKGCMHDVLKFKNGVTRTGVIAWNIMEHLPFRRMDLQPDNSWKPIRWPLPMGEVRDIPDSAVIHNSALRRMEANESYRPGNLIIGGGGRGIRVAPKKYGMGEWEVMRDKGDPIGECVIRKQSCGHKQVQQNGRSEDKDFEKI